MAGSNRSNRQGSMTGDEVRKNRSDMPEKGGERSQRSSRTNSGRSGRTNRSNRETGRKSA